MPAKTKRFYYIWPLDMHALWQLERSSSASREHFLPLFEKLLLFRILFCLRARRACWRRRRRINVKKKKGEARLLTAAERACLTMTASYREGKRVRFEYAVH